MTSKDFRGSRYPKVLDNLSPNGIPGDTISYFDYHNFTGLFWGEVVVDSASVEYYSRILYNAKQPILYDHYLGTDQVRFIWHRSFRDNYIFSVKKSGDPNFTIFRDNPHVKGARNSFTDPPIFVGKVEETEFYELKDLIRRSNFYAMESTKPSIQFDGEDWLLEVHADSIYHILHRGNPGLIRDDDLALRQIGEWFINKAKALDEDFD